MPKIGGSILPLGITLAPSPPPDTFLPGHLPLDSRQQMFRRLVVAANVEARNAEVVSCASEGGAEVEGTTVGRDGFLWETPVGQRCAEAVPEKEVLQ